MPKTRYSPIDASLFNKNRKKFIKQLPKGALAIFNSNDIQPTNADGVMGFHQNSDLFYLSGIDQEDTLLVLFPDSQNSQHKELLFVRETNDHIAVWEGEKLSRDEATALSGIKTVYTTTQFKAILVGLMSECRSVFLNTNEHTRADRTVQTRDDRFIGWMKEFYPLHHYHRSAPILADLRQIKSPIEIELLQEACSITEKAFRRVLAFVKPGVMEYEIEAEIIHTFIQHRSRKPAYPSIIASGKNALVLHYTNNNVTCLSGELILMDFGAEYANYAADLTRCIPVNGKFTKRQKEVYDAVLRIQRHAITLLKKGNTLETYNKAIAELVTKELIDLKVLSFNELKKEDKKHPLYKKYFMHGTSHFLGLDVHDVGNRFDPFKEGMVFTCEPGLYLKEEGIGIRLENDILITKTGNIDLMKTIPIETNEIEYIMNK